MKYLNKLSSHKLVITLSLIFFFFLLTVRAVRYDQVDYGIYLEYSKSILIDKDLNVSNQLLEIRKIRNEPILLTPTNYDPSYHPYMGSFLLSPILFFSKQIDSLLAFSIPDQELSLLGGVSKTAEDMAQESVLGLFNILLVYLSFYFIFTIVRNRISLERYVLFSHLLFLATPLFNYTVLEPGNMNLISFFLGSFFFKLLHFRNERVLSDFLLGAVFSIGFFVKYELALYIWLLLFLIYYDCKGSLSDVVKRYVKVFLGALPFISLFLINNYKQYGEIFLKYGSMRSDSFLLLEMLFSPLHGYFFASPFLLILGIGCIVYRSIFPIEIKLFLSFVCIKLLIDSLTLSTGINFGARNFLSDLSVLFVAFFLLENKIKGKVLNYILGAVTIWSLVWNSLYTVFLPGNTLSNYLSNFSEAGGIFIERVLSFEFSFSFIALSSLIFVFFWICTHFLLKNSNTILVFVLYTFFFFSLTTVSNFNTHMSTPEEAYSKGRGAELWLYIENIGSYYEREYKLTLNNRTKEALLIKKKGESYKKKAQSQIFEGRKKL